MLVKKITERMQRMPLELVQPAGVTREAAVLVALTRAADPRVVFIKRAGHLTRHSGKVAFPGGMRESGDPHQLYTVRVKFLTQGLKAGLELNYDSIKGHATQERVK